jgi:hypothetical protein
MCFLSIFFLRFSVAMTGDDTSSGRGWSFQYLSSVLRSFGPIIKTVFKFIFGNTDCPKRNKERRALGFRPVNLKNRNPGITKLLQTRDCLWLNFGCQNNLHYFARSNRISAYFS